MAGLQYVGSRGQAIKMPRKAGTASRYGWTFEVDAKDIAAITKKLEKASGLPLYNRMQRANLAAGDMLAKRMKQAAPRGPTGKLRKSIKARAGRNTAGQRAFARFLGARFAGSSTTVFVGPTARDAPHRHLVILGVDKERPSHAPGYPYMGMFQPGRTRTGKKALMLPGAEHPISTGSITTGRMPANPFVDRVARGFEKKAAEMLRREWEAALR